MSTPTAALLAASIRAVRPSLFFVLAGAIAAGLPSCATLRELARNVRQIESSGVVRVDLANRPATGSATTYAGVIRTDLPRPAIVAGKIADSNDPIIFLVPLDGTYRVAAFTDSNANRRWDDGEPGALGPEQQPRPLDSAQSAEVIPALSLSTAGSLPPGFPRDLPSSEDLPKTGAVPIGLGEVTDFRDPAFSAESGEVGYWRPYEFIERFGTGIYFVDDYDPGRIPVLFVYGAAGSPMDWKTAARRIDRSRYQPWIYLYPTGVHLDRASATLSKGIILLQQRHGFQKMHLVAHSMGGLVARGALLRLDEAGRAGVVDQFVTFSTPWGGHRAAESGVKHIKTPVPSWEDMVPGSDYIDEIFSRPLPSGVRHSLLFSFKSRSLPWLPKENDGTVGLASQIDRRAQNEADRIYGFEADHVGILSDDDALERLEQILGR